MNIILLEDIPEKGKHWKKGKVVFNVDKSYFEKYIEEGKVMEYGGKEPVWGVREKEGIREEEE